MLEATDAVRPLRDRVLVRELPWPGKVGSIYAPDQAQKHDELWRAVVVAVGPGKPPIGLLRRAIKLLAEFENAGGNAEYEPPSDEVTTLMADVTDGITVGFGADVKPGDVVLVSKYVHTKVRIGANMCCVIAASDILGVVAPGVEAVTEALLKALTRERPELAERIRSAIVEAA